MTDLDLEELKRLQRRSMERDPEPWTMADLDDLEDPHAEFVLAAVNALPALIAEVERLRTESVWLLKAATYD